MLSISRDLREFIEVALYDILHKLVGGPLSALRCEVVEPLFNLRGEVYFHALQGTRKLGVRQVAARQACSISSARRRARKLPSTRRLCVMASASAGVGSETGLLLHNAEIPNCAKARRYSFTKSAGCLASSRN